MKARFARERKLQKPRILLPGLLTNVHGLWIDAASGDGVFAEVLLGLCGPDATVLGLDLNIESLRRLRSQIEDEGNRLSVIQADLRSPLPVRGANGIILANILHFFPNSGQMDILSRCNHALSPGGELIIVEYNSDHATRAVPHPIPRKEIDPMLSRAGFRSTGKSAAAPSSYLGEMYAVLAESREP